MLHTEPVLDEAPLAVVEAVLVLSGALAGRPLEDHQSTLLLEQLGPLLVHFERCIRLGDKREICDYERDVNVQWYRFLLAGLTNEFKSVLRCVEEEFVRTS